MEALGFVIICIFWNIYWIIEDVVKKRSYFNRLNFKIDFWCSIFFWMFNLIGLFGLIWVIIHW